MSFTPRVFIGVVLLALTGFIFAGFLHPHSLTNHLARLVIFLMTAFVGTQVFRGKRLPGFRRRTRTPHVA